MAAGEGAGHADGLPEDLEALVSRGRQGVTALRTLLAGWEAQHGPQMPFHDCDATLLASLEFAPFLAADVRDLLAILKVEKNIGCRNAALLTLGFGAALRRSELVGLDWQELGEGTGFVRIDERGILITLARSKGSQDKAETVVIPRADFEPACEALEAWAARVPLSPAEPIFRAVNNRDQIAAERLTAHSVRAMRDIARKRGKTIEEAKELMRRFSGHQPAGGLRHLGRSRGRAGAAHRRPHAP